MWERDDNDDMIIKKLGLTDKQATFCELYKTVEDMSGGSAYKIAFDKEKVNNYCYMASSRLLGTDKIKNYLTHLQQRLDEKNELRDEDIQRKWFDMFNTDITEVATIKAYAVPLRDSETKQIIYDDEKGLPVIESYTQVLELKDLEKLPKNKRLAINTLFQTKEGFKVGLVEKNKLGELLGKSRGMFIDKKEVDMTGGVQIVMPGVDDMEKYRKK